MTNRERAEAWYRERHETIVAEDGEEDDDALYAMEDLAKALDEAEVRGAEAARMREQVGALAEYKRGFSEGAEKMRAAILSKQEMGVFMGGPARAVDVEDIRLAQAKP